MLQLSLVQLSLSLCQLQLSPFLLWLKLCRRLLSSIRLQLLSEYNISRLHMTPLLNHTLTWIQCYRSACSSCRSACSSCRSACATYSPACSCCGSSCASDSYHESGSNCSVSITSRLHITPSLSRTLTWIQCYSSGSSICRSAWASCSAARSCDRSSCPGGSNGESVAIN